jgi:hypothetical protein
MRKLVPLTMILATMALVAPAMASASPALTSPAGVLVPFGSSVKMTSTNWVLQTVFGALGCPEMSFDTKVEENNGKSFDLAGPGSIPFCHVLQYPLVYEGVTLKELSATEIGKGTASLSFGIRFSPSLTCEFTATKVPFVYTPGTNQVVFGSSPLVSKPTACGSASFHATFSFTKPGGELVKFD